jgi:hypothetical protein
MMKIPQNSLSMVLALFQMFQQENPSMNSHIGHLKQKPSSLMTDTDTILLVPASIHTVHPWSLTLTSLPQGSLLFQRAQKALGLSPQSPARINGCSSWFYPSWLEDWTNLQLTGQFVSTIRPEIGDLPLMDQEVANLPPLICLRLVTDCPAGQLNVSSGQILRSWNVFMPAEHEVYGGTELDRATLLLGWF